jgi:hypothetical protein
MTESQPTPREPTTWTLLDAVDDLTLVRHRRERQDILTDGHVTGQQTVHITLPPLLTQLAEAIRANMGGTSNGASLSFERNLLDADALMKLVQIDSQIRDWCRGQKLVPGKDPAQNLRAWYVAQMQHQHSEDVDTAHIKILGKWTNTIRAKLDPHRERELPDECPTCGAGTWWRDGHEYFHPLVIRYKPSTGPDMVQQARGMCRACETVWGVRELAYELEVRNSETEVA